ncbi:Acetyltransferase (GNAT) family protein [Candidatus Rubidus massiliensis]|nr:Acetyltransferase (GNAT) family protein [Candidatus Rubidus massiliensis]
MRESALSLHILRERDISGLVETFNFPWASLEVTQEKWKKYYAEQNANIRTVCIAKVQDESVGYGSLLNISEYPNFKDEGIPEIHDVWVSEKHRGTGIGKRLVQYLEGLAQQKNHKQIGIGVGLYKDYGRAQRLHVHLGYAPDGHGVTYKYQPIVPGDPYPIDDDLVIWFKKDLP